MAEIHKVYGLGAEFDSAADLLHAAEKVRDGGFKRWDVHTPFPVHGMDAAMGLGKSWLSAPVLAGGIAGLLTAVGLTMIPSFVLYPIIVHGKPYNFFSSPAFVPIFFELTVLASAFTSVFSIMAFNRLPQWYHPVFNWERFKRSTDDGFFLVIEARDPKFNEAKTRELLESIGGKHVTLIHD
jgi:hypothetical protein